MKKVHLRLLPPSTVALAGFFVTKLVAAQTGQMPTVEEMLSINPAYLAQGLLTQEGSASMARAYVDRGWDVTINMNGVPQKINKDNIDEVVAKYEATAAIYREAIQRRGFQVLRGKYLLAASPECVSEELDPRVFFMTSGTDGSQRMVETVEIRQNEFRTELVIVVQQEGQTTDVVFPGVVVEKAIVSKVPNMELNLWGRLVDRTIEMYLDVQQVKEALGATEVVESAWTNLEKCRFTFTPTK